MKTAVIVLPGSTATATSRSRFASRHAEPLMVWHKEADFEAVDLIVLPGGFSYGDYLRAGMAAIRR